MVSQQAQQLAQQVLKRRAQGKSSAGIFYEAEKAGIRQEVQQEVARIQEGRQSTLTPEEFKTKEAVQRGVEARIAAKEGGFESTKEFISVSKQLHKQPVQERKRAQIEQFREQELAGVEESRGMEGETSLLRRERVTESREAVEPLGAVFLKGEEARRMDIIDVGSREDFVAVSPEKELPKISFFDTPAGKVLTSEELVGFGTGVGVPDITFKEIKGVVPRITETIGKYSFKTEDLIAGGFGEKAEKRAKTGKFFGEVLSELIPTTPLEIGAAGIIGTAVIAGPPIVAASALGVTSILGGRSALDVEATPAQRFAGGATAVLAGLGATTTIAPFVKGSFARFSPKFRPVETQKILFSGKEFEAEFITGFKADSKISKIGLIPEGSPKFTSLSFAPGEAATVRGGRTGFSLAEQTRAFSGKELRLTTSQRGLDIGEGIIKPDPAVSELGFFFTPADPTLKFPQTRVSRLGLTGLVERPSLSNVEFGVGLSDKAQIFVTEPVKIGTKKTIISPKGSSELEVTSKANIEILGKAGVTTIEGRKIDIFSSRLTGASPTSMVPLKVGDIVPLSFKPPRKISITSFAPSRGLASSLVFSPMFYRRDSPIISPPISLGISPTFKPPVSLGISPPISLGISPTFKPPVSLGISPPIRTPISPGISPPIRTSINPRIFSSITRRPPKKFLFPELKFGNLLGYPITGTRGFYRPPSLVVRGLKGTGFELPKISSPLASEITGITTIFELKKKRKRRKK